MMTPSRQRLIHPALVLFVLACVLQGLGEHVLEEPQPAKAVALYTKALEYMRDAPHEVRVSAAVNPENGRWSGREYGGTAGGTMQARLRAPGNPAWDGGG